MTVPRRFDIRSLSESQLRLDIVIPVLNRIPSVERVTDVHGKNERGLDIIFFDRTPIGVTCFGLQLKAERIGGGGTAAKGQNRTVVEILTQLHIARNVKHSIAVGRGETVQIDAFIVATSDVITDTAREEIATWNKDVRVLFWDGNEILRLVRQHFPELLVGSDASKVDYLKEVMVACDRLDALDQISEVATRTLSQIFVECQLRRRFDAISSTPTLSSDPDTSLGAMSLLGSSQKHVLIIGEQNDGKTSILRMLALKAARNYLTGVADAMPIPILLQARRLVGLGSVIGAAKEELARRGGEACAAGVEDELTGGRYFIGVDGFSEMGSVEDRNSADILIREFVAEFPECRVIVTARPADFLQPRYLQAFAHYTIEQWDERQTRSLVTKWTAGISVAEDVASRMVHRVREALQLPGSPIPAIIGVLVYSEEQRYITNTADAVDRYMVIRLGRYAKEMGLRQEVDWARKQDLLSEVAFRMVNDEVLDLSDQEFVEGFDAILDRFGETRRGDIAFQELVNSGVLVEAEGRYGFHRTAFRDFIACPNIRRRQDAREFIAEHLFDRKWGSAVVFAAGLSRHNSALIRTLVEEVDKVRLNDLSAEKADFLYGSYLLGRILANSESTEVDERFAALRVCLRASSLSIEQFTPFLKEEFGGIGEIAALMAVDNSFFVTVGVPWLENQLRALADDPDISEDERYMCASACAHLAVDGFWNTLDRLVRAARTTKVLIVLRVLARRILRERTLSAADRASADEVIRRIDRQMVGRKKDVDRLTEIRSKVLALELQRLKRLSKPPDK